MSAFNETDPFSDGQLIDVSGGDVTPSKITRGFYVGNTAGTVRIITKAGTTLDIQSVANQYHPWKVRTFVQTGTTVGMNIIAGWG